MARTIVYDDLNLSLRKGTGIATYARGLLGVARELNYQTRILHDVQGRIPRDPVLREIVLFDDVARKSGAKARALRWLKRSIGFPLGVKPARIHLHGHVVAKSFNTHLAQIDTVFAAEDLYGRARQHFRRTGSIASVSFDTPPDIFHCTHSIPLKARRACTIYTLHDVVPLKLPYLSDDNKRYHYRLLRSLVRDADHIVTVSEASRSDIIQILGVDERRITNTYQAVDVPLSLRCLPEDDVASQVRGAFDLEWKEYFLFFGALEPKKNVARLVEAYLAANVRHPLVIVGGTGWNSNDEKSLIADERFGFYQRDGNRLRMRRQIRHHDFVSYPMLVKLVRGARGVVFPSLYEGFGLPVLEAMQLGTPVISSTEGSLPEVAGQAAILVDPYDADALRGAIRALANDDDLCGELREAGLRQAEKFSVERYRNTVGDLYESLLRSRGG